MRVFLGSIIGLVAVNVLMWIFFMPRYINSRIARFQNDLVSRHYDEVESMYRKMRGWRHDYHNHIQTMKAYMSMGEYEQANEYLDRLETDLTTVDTVLKTGNIMVDAILNSKLTLIAARQIPVDATAVVPGDIAISGIDLSVIIGNLLDNAMEACMQVPPQKRFIRIYIDIIKKQLYISVTNSMEGRAKRNGVHFLSDKEGNHGFGLLRIDSITARYGGFVNRQSENGVFATEVMLPLVDRHSGTPKL